ncbi:MAG TPA: hypothetical protein PLK94_09895, partial [Alphaproteobacteria bacterium]|nr:hypothetical protein [Alphaproteobacteria bacterium]
EMSGLAAGFSELIASMTNEELREGISPKFVESLAGGMALNANKMGVSEADTQAFVDRISGDPKLQEAIAANLKENPGFIRRMAKASQDSGTDTQDLFKDMARSEMEKLMANPELLANKGYVKKLDDGLKLRDGLGKLMDENGPLGKLWKGLKEFLDIDGMPSFGGMDFMGMIKDLINGIAKMFGLPQIVAGNSTTPMHPQLTSQLERSSMLAVKGPDGKFTHDVHQGRQMVKVPNTISVQNENGEMIDVIPTEGAKLIAKSSTGAVTLRVAQSINSDGTVKSVKTVNLSKEGYESYERQLKERGATIATQDVSQRPKVETVRLDHKTGAEIPTPDAKPNDLDLTRKLAQNPNAPMADMGLDMGMTSG